MIDVLSQTLRKIIELGIYWIKSFILSIFREIFALTLRFE